MHFWLKFPEIFTQILSGCFSALLEWMQYFNMSSLYNKKTIKGFICLIWFAIYHSQNFCIKITILPSNQQGENCNSNRNETVMKRLGTVSSLDPDLPAKIFRCCCVSTPSNHPMFICMCISNSSTEHFQCCWSGTATKSANQQPT